jgi:hypothetical protein
LVTAERGVERLLGRCCEPDLATSEASADLPDARVTLAVAERNRASRRVRTLRFPGSAIDIPLL